MNSSALENREVEFEKIQRKIELAEEKQSKYQEKLENAITAGEPEFILTNIRTLLDSATQELHDLRQEKLELLKKETAFELHTYFTCEKSP